MDLSISALRTSSYYARLAVLIVVCTCMRLAVAAFTDLGNDEVYYFTYAVQPDWNHFDHPPLVGIFIRIFTFNLHWISTLTMRLPAIGGAAVATFFIAQCGRLVRNERAGLLAAAMYQVCIYTSIISGAFILPDSIQLVFWLKALLTALRWCRDEKSRQLLAFGFWTGLTILCKVHGVFLWAGLLAIIFSGKKRWLSSRYLYLSLLITAVIIAPILLWNIDNDFITWRFHSERVTVQGSGINVKSLLVTTLGQIGYANPILFALLVICMWRISRNKKLFADTRMQLLWWTSLPMLLVTVLISAFRPTLPHWSGPALPSVIIAAAWLISLRSSDQYAVFYYKMVRAAAILVLAVFVAGLLMINFYPGTMGSARQGELGKGDATLDMQGWNQLRPRFARIRQADVRSGKMRMDAPLVLHKWFPGAHLYYYAAYPLQMPVRGVGRLEDLHKFYWFNTLSKQLSPGDNAYYITPSNNCTDPATIYAGHFAGIERIADLPQYRNGKVARYWTVYRLLNAQKSF